VDLIADFFDMRGSCSHRASLLLGRERPADAARGVAAQLPRSPHEPRAAMSSILAQICHRLPPCVSRLCVKTWDSVRRALGFLAVPTWSRLSLRFLTQPPNRQPKVLIVGGSYNPSGTVCARLSAYPRPPGRRCACVSSCSVFVCAPRRPWVIDGHS